MITVESLKMTELERDLLLKWSAIFFENGVRLMSLANFVNERTVHKEMLADFLQDKIRHVLEHYRSDSFYQLAGGDNDNIKCINESAYRMILSMLEMIKIEGGEYEDNEA